MRRSMHDLSLLADDVPMALPIKSNNTHLTGDRGVAFADDGFAQVRPPLSLPNSASGLKIRAPILRGPKNGPPTCAYRGAISPSRQKLPKKPNPRASLKVDGPLRCSNLSSLSRVAPVASFQKAGYNLALGMLNNACRLASSASRLNLRIRTPKAPECAQTEVCPPFSASKPPDLHTPGACVCAGGRFTARAGR